MRQLVKYLAAAAVLAAGNLAAAQVPTSQPTTEPSSLKWDTYADTWVATDGLGRSLPTFDDVGPPKPNKTAILFYYMWLDDHSGVVRDVAKVLRAKPDARIPLENDDWYFWGEPLLGYYLLTDPFVHRLHAAMLSEAGIDAIMFDSSNGYIHEPQYLALCKVYEQIRQSGQAAPAIGHLLHAKPLVTAQLLYDKFYSQNLYPNLWFRWDGKPLLMTDPTGYPETLTDFFTIRKTWAWHDPNKWFGDGHDAWPWIDTFPQQFGWHDDANTPEELSVSAAQHPSSTIGRSYHDGAEPPPGKADPAAGLYFDEQWSQALKVSPQALFITNFNEWIAKGYPDEHAAGKPPRKFLGRPMVKGEAFFVDEYSPEFSRDIEPAAPTPANRGVNDNYYYQMVANLRKYKGVRPLAAVAPQLITIDGKFDDWQAVSPEFRDTIGDPVHRDFAGFGKGTKYVNQTGRNDIVASKVSVDAANLYFYVRTAAPLTPATDKDWMVLYLDTDHDAKTGWLGYDYAINRTGDRTIVESNVGGSYGWAKSADGVRYAVQGNEMEIAIPRTAINLTSLPATIDFKWADHCYSKGDWTDFTLNGDAAPDMRFNFRAKLEAGK